MIRPVGQRSILVAVLKPTDSELKLHRPVKKSNPNAKYVRSSAIFIFIQMLELMTERRRGGGGLEIPAEDAQAVIFACPDL